ncbi:bifunctional uridylyltransferase/uridylyl-removing protein GlnD [Thaumasiovibrio subtropicus]|uniref:bifunctional uridylyltransferase/uridylyl-removing protein GlnD n=1 Tax=Thaumasiovibrio subtropicus TaxID=1891207 RepID=UPI000B34D1F8|nr:bifunctional uridylyltransferase/uridylyl-removing protein GlnD [Thaumasiovibrio subtropicus]
MTSIELTTPIETHSIKQQLDDYAQQQKDAFCTGGHVTELVLERSQFMDKMLLSLWQHYGFDNHPDLALIAVGGYGRAELHPLSDIDILFLSQTPLDDAISKQLSEFVTLLWDLRLDVGHSVRTLAECKKIADEDLTVATNLLESRLLCGHNDTYEQLVDHFESNTFWPSADFYAAKVNEQLTRHARYNDTAYNLEPDIKSTPGGLRDIHTLSWIARRHFGATSLREMSKYGFLTDAEFRELAECQDFLWRVRFALHLELRRYDNRLTFGHQSSVAELLQYQGEGNQGVERMMKDFYRTLQRVVELNKMLLQLFQQAILEDKQPKTSQILDDDFEIKGNVIEARKPALFQARPDTILDMFLHIASHSEVDGIAAPTLRQLRTARRRLNRFLIDIPEARDKFMALVRHPNALLRAFPLMHRHGVLAAYLPQWSQIVGQMQFDLFHVYTVDEHTMRLLKNLQKFSLEESRERHPVCCEVYPRLIKKDLLILAGIFHDIGKGRGGDHSEIGEEESYHFCIQHGLTRPEAKLVAWLVRHHLLMSVTAQRRDIYDQEVIAGFAEEVGDEEHLDYLICLTVADICATNKELWNSWKRTLIAELYYSTQKTLRRGLENPPDVRDRIKHNQQLASALLRKQDIAPRDIETLWQRFNSDYFLRHTHKQIAWHSQHLIEHDDLNKPLVLVSRKATRGGTEVFIHTRDKQSLFANVAAELDKKNLSIHDAQIMTSKDGFIMDTFMVLDPNGKAIPANRHDRIVEALTKTITTGSSTPKRHRPSRKLQHFDVETVVTFLPVKRTQRKTLMELVALDMPGLLAVIGKVFEQLNLNLHAAKITTIGERAEDFFTLTTSDGDTLNDSEQEELANLLRKEIEALGEQ